MTTNAVVRQLRPDEPTAATRPAAELAAESQAQVAVVRDWPKRTALLVGSTTGPRILESLHKHGLIPFAAGTDHTDEITSAGPFTFMIVSAECLYDDDCVERIQRLHSRSPSARVLLEYSPHDRDPGILLRSLRAGVQEVFDPADATAIDEMVLSGLRGAGKNRERVLAIGAHPDDVEIGCGGTLFDHQLRGDRISILTLSRGPNGLDQQQRFRDATAAAEGLGAQLLFGDLPDEQIEDGGATIRMIEEVVRSLDPTVVYVHSPHDSHDDHRAVSIAAGAATVGVRRVFGYQSPTASDEFRPTRFVPIDTVLGRKVAALLLFDSQNGRSYLEPELVIAGSRYWARHLGSSARYAEPFEVIRSVGELHRAAPRQIADLGQPAGADSPPRLSVVTQLEIGPW